MHLYRLEVTGVDRVFVFFGGEIPRTPLRCVRVVATKIAAFIYPSFVGGFCHPSWSCRYY